MTEDEFKSRILEKLDLALFWLKMQNLQNAKAYFAVILNTEEKLKAYAMSDGKSTIEDIMKATGVKSTGTISNWWTEWLAKGIVQESTSHAGRKQKVIDLSELGLA
jgi:hypothetical protein